MKIKRIILLIFFLVAVAVLSLLIGSVDIPLKELFVERYRGILVLRLSRVILAAVAGASLATVGAILQGLLKNPLADPYVLGVSSGAGLGAVLAIVFGLNMAFFGAFSLPISSFIGGALTIFFVYIFSKKSQRVSTEDLLLSGVIITAMLSGIIMFIVSVIETEGLHNVLWWLLGNLQIFDLRLLFAVSAIAVIGIIISCFFARSLNIMSLGEEEAITMGLNVEYIKLVFFIISSLIVAAVVAVCGMIGFVGLIIPHIARRLVGPDHRSLIPASAICGAIFLILCDLLARRIMAPTEMPVGVITAVFGGPFFIILLKRSRRPIYR